MINYNWHRLSQDDRAQFWSTLALRHSHGLGPRLIVRLLRRFGSAYAAIQNLNLWQEVGIKSDIIASVSAGAWRENALIEWKDAQKSNAHIILWHNEVYPPILRTLIDAPSLLYAHGDLTLFAGPCMAIVGSRKCTADGVSVAATITRELSAAGITIVSGMAQGIDRVAHVAALNHVGKSIAVLGTGIDVIYPKPNADIYADLTNDGLVISEYAPNTAPIASNFPIRNRIISGVSLGVLVVEGTLRSGTLITARQALEQNREVFAIPGTANAEASQGCQELIRQGAKVVFTAEDILCDMAEQLKAYSHMFNKSINPKIKLTNTEKTCKAQLSYDKDTLLTFSSSEQEDIKSILKFLYGHGESNVDSICMALEKPAHEVNSLLMTMELSGLVKRLPGAKYLAMSALA